MTDNDLFRLIIGIIRTSLAAQSISANVRQAYQPRQQGTPTQNSVLINKLYNKRYGYMLRSDVWDNVHEVIVHTERQWIEASFQISALAIQDPTDPTLLTASDLVNVVAQIMQTDQTLAALRVENVGIYRITQIRNPYFTDDKERFEASPSFDFTVTYEQIYISQTPVLQSTEFNIVPV